MVRHWRSPASLLLPIGEALGRLVCDEDFTDVKACAGENCTLLFADHTRRRARRWCSMAIFGNRASVTRVRDVVEDAEEIGPTIPRSDATRTADHGLADDLGRPDGSAGGSPEETLLDEDALRELVVEIVRQELQGALDERITRNVRKLVRREIYRVISSEDFS